MKGIAAAAGCLALIPELLMILVLYGLGMLRDVDAALDVIEQAAMEEW